MGRCGPPFAPSSAAHRSSRFLLNVAKKARGVPREVMLNGQPALVFLDGAAVTAALIVDSSEAKIVAVRLVSNPDKLARLNREVGPGKEVPGRRGAPIGEQV